MKTTNWDNIKSNGNFRKHRRGNSKKFQALVKHKLIKRSTFYANKLTRNATKAETKLMGLLNSAHITYSFQVPIYGQDNGFRIVDFSIPRPHNTILVVEVDGEYHFTTKQLALDIDREKWLIKNTGCKILRFKNEEVFIAPQTVIARITEMINSS